MINDKSQTDFKDVFFTVITDDICPECGNIVEIKILPFYCVSSIIDSEEKTFLKCSKCKYEWIAKILLKMNIIELKIEN